MVATCEQTPLLWAPGHQDSPGGAGHVGYSVEGALGERTPEG